MIFRREALLCSLQGLTESELIDWLQQIIERTDFERVHSVVIECGDKNYRRHFVCTDCCDYIETVELRHLHIEKNEIGFELANCRDSLCARFAFSKERNVARPGE